MELVFRSRPGMTIAAAAFVAYVERTFVQPLMDETLLPSQANPVTGATEPLGWSVGGGFAHYPEGHPRAGVVYDAVITLVVEDAILLGLTAAQRRNLPRTIVTVVEGRGYNQVDLTLPRNLQLPRRRPQDLPPPPDFRDRLRQAQEARERERVERGGQRRPEP